MEPGKYSRKPPEGFSIKEKVQTPHYVSMVIDAHLKRRTEIDFMNGAVVSEGKKYGIPTPYNETVCRLVRIMQDTYNFRYEPPA
jgi:2-dehydropantoate 2-reductase